MKMKIHGTEIFSNQYRTSFVSFRFVLTGNKKERHTLYNALILEKRISFGLITLAEMLSRTLDLRFIRPTL
jgi:hypothetical protein